MSSTATATTPVSSSPAPNLFVDAHKINVLMNRNYSAADFARFGTPPEPHPEFFTFFNPGFNVSYIAVAEVPDPYDKQKRCRIFPETPGLRTAKMYATKGGHGCYHQVRISPVRDSIGKPINGITRFVGVRERLATPQTIVMAKAIYYLVNGGARLWEDYYLPTEAWDDEGEMILIGGSLHFVVDHDRFDHTRIALVTENILK